MNFPNREQLNFAILILLVTVVFMGSIPVEAVAQQSQQNQYPPHLQKKRQQLEQWSVNVGSQSAGQLQPVQSGIDYGSLNGMYTTFEQDQSWNLNPNSNPAHNFALFQQGQPAGNVNGDSTSGNPVSDYIVTSQARDENTSALYDQTWKTAVFFGGNTTGNPDQIIRRKLIPVGDLNGDGYDDAVSGESNLKYSSTDNQPSYIYKGTANGYVKTAKVLYEGFHSTQKQIGFNDYNRDGYEDVLSYYPYDTAVIITWGAPLFSDVSFTSYSSVLPSGSKQLAVHDVDQDTLKEIVTFAGVFGDGQIQINEVDSTAQVSPSTGIQQEQMFGFTAFGGSADDPGKALHLIDINGSGYSEVFLSTGTDTSKYVFEYDSTNNQYITSAINFFDGKLVPVGNLNNDSEGKHDFIQGTANGKAYISYGTSDLSSPGQDVALSGNAGTNWSWNMQYNPYSEFGDLTGDGIDDGLLSHTEESSGSIMIGRRILGGSGSGNFSSTFHQYPKENFYSRIMGTEEIGDINGDGVEDFAMGGEQQRIMVFYGDSSISKTPDLTLSLSYHPNNITAGDFTGDGNQDLIISGRQDEQALFKLFEGSGLTPAKTVYASDFQTVDAPYIHGAQNIGDVNADGVDDFLTGSSTAHDNTGSGLSYLNEAYIFFGGSAISSSPDATIPMSASSSNYTWAGETAASLGDINGDGANDFAVSAAFAMNPDESRGKVFVMYGGTNATFTEPDMVLRPEKLAGGFGWGIAAGDYSGDAVNDFAVSAISFSSGEMETAPPTAIHVYYGGLDFDMNADQFLALPRFNIYQDQIESDGYHFGMNGTIEVISDFTNDGRDELLFSSSRFQANHAALYTFSTGDPNPTSVLRAPNKAAGLGGMSNMATGDFDNNGELDLVLTQTEDNNDAYRSSRVYRFGLPRPITITKVEDVPDDQGRRIRIYAGGYLMEAMNRDIYGMDNWSVWRMTEDSSWTNVKTVSPSSAGARFVDVTVNKTQPTNVDSIDNSYTFRLEAFNRNKGGVIARSDTSSGMAFDNISPPQVQNMEINQQNGDRMMSWQSSEANDIGKYLVYRAKDGRFEKMPVGASNTTNFTLPNSFSGVQNFAVKARDVNNNTGAASPLASAIYPKKVKFDIKSGWNLIGLPVNANADSIQKALQSASNIYEYSGGYTQVDQFQAGVGYWAKFSQSDLRELQGTPVTELSLNLKKGWNLISGVGGALPLTMVQDPDEIIIQNTLYNFDQAYSQSDTLRPSSGYWVRTSAAGTVTFTHPKLVTDQQSAGKKNPLAKQRSDLKKNFSKITVTDGKHSRELYFGSSLAKQVDKREFSLPPLAPGDFFDARFSKGTKLIEKAEGTIKLKRIDGTDIAVEIDPQNMAEQSRFLIRELANGKELAEYKVDAGKKVTLKHSETNAIFVTAVGNSPLTQNEVPDEFKLSQNYPNPFNPTTQIEYSVAEASQVTLEVFNILGKRVATLINQEQQPGNYEVTFDGSNLASGVYLYRLQAGTYVSTKKLILAK